jgi:hypothetical protein
MDLNKGARKLRHAAEREATGKNRDAARRESDTKAAEAHPEVTNSLRGLWRRQQAPGHKPGMQSCRSCWSIGRRACLCASRPARQGQPHGDALHVRADRGAAGEQASAGAARRPVERIGERRRELDGFA